MYKGQSQETLQTKPTNKWKHKSNTIIDHKHKTLTHTVTCHTILSDWLHTVGCL